MAEPKGTTAGRGGAEDPEVEVVERARSIGAPGDAVIATDVAGTILYWNDGAERLYGWSAAEVLGQNILEVTPSDLSLPEAERIMGVLRQGGSWRGEFEVRTRSGQTLAVNVTDAPVRSSSGELVGIIGLSRPAGSPHSAR